MLKKLAILFSLPLILSLLSGCAFNKPAAQADVCTKMKRELIFRTGNPNHEAAWTTQAQKEAFKQKMRENNCI